MLRVLLPRLRALFTRRRDESRLRREIREHLKLLAAEHVGHGLSPDAAREKARRDFGGVEQMKEAYRDERGLAFIDRLAQDVRHAARTLRRYPVVAATAIVSLALGIGATTVVFSLINAAVLRPLAVTAPDALVLLAPFRNSERYILFNPEFEELRARQHSLTGIFAASEAPYLRTIIDSDPPVYVAGSLVSGNYFEVLGLTPAVGRLLDDADDMPSDSGNALSCAAVISDAFWSRRFERRPDAIGTTLVVRNQECTIVGVTPAGFKGHRLGFTSDVWLPLRRLTERRLLEAQTMAFFSGVMGRLRPGVTRLQAQSELTTLYRQIQSLEPPRPRDPHPDASVLSMRVLGGAQGLDGVRREYGEPLVLLLAAVAIVLFIAAANVANLLVARGITRLPELATRAALGAGRWRIVRQLAIEGGVIAGIGGLVGLAVAIIAMPLASTFVFRYTRIVLDTTVDVRVLTAAVTTTLFAALVIGLIPAVRLSRIALQHLATSGRLAIGSVGHQRVTKGLLVFQFALSLLLVTAAGLLMRTFVGLSSVDLGFRPDGAVVMLEVADESPGPGFSMADSQEARQRRAIQYALLEERLNALQGVRSAALSWLGLFSANDLWTGITGIPGVPESAENPQARVDFVSSRYFETVGMELVRGRGFTDADRAGAQRVAVINEAMSRRFFGDREPLGSLLGLDLEEEQGRPFTVVGIIRDSRYNSVRETETSPMMWMPLVQAPYRVNSVTLRTAPGAPADIADRAAAICRSLDPYLMVRRVTTLENQVRMTTAREWLLTYLSWAFGACALLLTAIGLYGSLAYSVAQRTREIGVRMALGAMRGSVVRMFLREAVTLAALATALGIPLALAAASSLRGFLFGVVPQDPATMIAASAVLGLTAITAACIPALRASRIEPSIALKGE